MTFFSRFARLSGIIAILVLGAASSAFAFQSAGVRQHDFPVPEVHAVALDEPVILDGRLDESVWRSAPATQRTEVRFAFDDDALYIGARMYDDLGADGVRTRLARRDAYVDGDALTIVFDPYHDHLTRAEFRINPSGTKDDALGPGGSGLDSSWDPIWDAATRIDSLGWTAEIRIPFSQLNFSTDSLQTWGLQIVRMASRLNERTHWSFWRQNEVGGPSRYGHLEGIRIDTRPRGLEVMPYVVGRTAFLSTTDPADPFRADGETTMRVGADFRYRMTSNLTLSGTINPDFGQVEVDPAVVNLSAFETFFDEKRPFFVEGAGLFSFGGLNCFFCSNVSSLSVFYSRRIGRAPEGASLARDAGAYTDVPANTTIVGAAKMTGRMADGTSVALLNAVTRRENASVVTADGTRLVQEVAPLANYFVGRLKRDFRDGDVVVGGVFSSVYRDFDDPALAGLMSRHAEVGGVDADIWWGARTYRLMAKVAVSQVAGEPEAIRRQQRSSARYFQRPDRESSTGGFFSNGWDPDATMLRGYGAYARLAKDAGDWLWEASVNLRSPGFEINDVAFLTAADYVWTSANLMRQFTTPTRYFRRLTLIAGGQQEVNYSGDLISRQLHAYAGAQLPNYWTVSGFYMRWPERDDDRLTRGGPVVRVPRGGHISFNLSTDERGSIVLGTNPNLTWRANGTRDYNVNLSLTYRPASNVSVRVGPGYSHRESATQYVDAWDDATAEAFGGRRYLFGDLRQRTVSMDTRLSVTFTPALSLELFAQPYISAARYSAFKEYEAPRTTRMRTYGEDFGTLTRTTDGYTVDPAGEAGGAAAYSFDDPDFNFRSLRGNAVLRWEYRPGSTLFLVWTQDRNDTAPTGDLRLDRDRQALFSAPADHIFQLKASYWLNP